MINEQKKLRETLRDENSRKVLHDIKIGQEERVVEQSIRFFEEYLPEHVDDFKRWGLGTRLAKNPLSFELGEDGNPVTSQSCNRWLGGEEKMPRAAAHQLCILLNLGLEDSEIFFNIYLSSEFTRFNEWTEVLYRYCIEKEYDIQKTYELYLRCAKEAKLSDDVAVNERANKSVTILTSVIKGGFDLNILFDDNRFIDYMIEQKDNFHDIRSTRRREIIKIMKSLGKDYLASNLAEAFYYEDDDEGDVNEEYFLEALKQIEKRSLNFSREFFILCLLIGGKNSTSAINHALVFESIDFPSLNVNNIFDACVFEACEQSDDSELSAYIRFCENTKEIKFTRPRYFASDY